MTDARQPKQDPTLDKTTILLLVVTILAWASSFVAIGAGLKGFGAIELGAARFWMAIVPAVLFLLISGAAMPARSDAWRLAAGGVLFIALYTILLNLGQQTVSAGPAAFLINTNPIITAVLSMLLLGERFGRMAWIGTLVSMVGVALIAGSQEGPLRFDLGALLILGAAACNSVTAVIQKPLFARYSPVTVVAWNIVAGSLVLLPWLPSAMAEAGRAPAGALLAAVYLALVPSLVAYATWAALIARMPVSRASNFMYCVPPITLVFAALVLGEIPTTMAVFGGALALAGVVVVNLSR